MDIIRAIEQQQIKQDLPEFNVGDNVKVHYRITEGNRERIQVFRAMSSVVRALRAVRLSPSARSASPSASSVPSGSLSEDRENRGHAPR